ncbi:MAG: AAA family ATPase [Oscillospiraceae bacterium]|nr:AAA family ATPase [Oscillospiraceae bacterium]
MGIYLNQNNDLLTDDRKKKIYIDKSNIIIHTNAYIDEAEKYICVSRPRRFGKSMAANMLVAYYSRGCDSRKLFSDLEISKDPTFEKHLNKYNVIHLDMNDYDYLSVKDAIEEISSEIIEELIEENPFLKDVQNLKLIKALEKVFIKTRIPFVFIIDEWDLIMRKKNYNSQDQEDYLSFLKRLLKGKSYVALCYMTGILPIKKYGEHSALNIFDEYSMEDQAMFAKSTGFTEQEVEKIQSKYNFDMDEAKKWYNGYNVNGIAIYNPRSIVELCKRGTFSNYWTKTETYEALKVYIQMNFDGLKDKIELMLSGEKVEIDVGTFQNDMTSFGCADDVLALLIHLGYLTYDMKTKSCWIPNHEVAEEFIRSVKMSNWTEVMNAINQSEECLKATLNGDSETVARIIEQTHEENTSIIKYNDENSLACVVTLSYYTARNKYFTIRELPTGKGYADIAFIPRKNENVPAIIVELKKEQSPEIALKQIREKNYFECLKNYSGEVLLVGLNYTTDNNTGYKKHTCKIEKIVK